MNTHERAMGLIMRKHIAINKTGSAQDIGTPPKEDQPTMPLYSRRSSKTVVLGDYFRLCKASSLP